MPKAIIRAISPRMNECELTHLEREEINISRAIFQHEQYVKTLIELNCDILQAEPAPEFADSVFVEDCAIVLDEMAIITLPGAESRRGEVNGIQKVLTPHRRLFQILSPGILDGGDVLVIGKKIWVGLSFRSNLEAVKQFIHLVYIHILL